MKGSRRIGMVIGVKSMDVDGRKVDLNAPPLLVNNRAYAPLRAVSEGLGAGVAWTPEGDGGRIDIITR